MKIKQKNKTKLAILFLFLIAAAIITIEFSFQSLQTNTKTNSITGFATDSASDISGQLDNIYDIGIEVGTLGTYYLNPSFKASSEADTEVYSVLITDAKEFVEAVKICGKEKMKDTGLTEKKIDIYGNEEEYKIVESDLELCVEQLMPKTWLLDCEQKDIAGDEYFMFCYSTGQYTETFSSQNTIEEKEAIIKFALYFKREKSLELMVPDCNSIVSSIYSYSCLDSCPSSSIETSLGKCRQDTTKVCCQSLK